MGQQSLRRGREVTVRVNNDSGNLAESADGTLQLTGASRTTRQGRIRTRASRQRTWPKAQTIHVGLHTEGGCDSATRDSKYTASIATTLAHSGRSGWQLRLSGRGWRRVRRVWRHDDGVVV